MREFLLPDGNSCCKSAEGACNAEACSLVEGGDYAPSSLKIKVTAPVFSSCVCLLCDVVGKMLPVDTGMGVSAIRTSFERPEDFNPTWQFVQRAAQPPRAPSLVLA